jgi:hypothetical protein
MGDHLDAVLTDVLPRLLGAAAGRPDMQDATPVTLCALRAAARALGRAAARDGLTPDALLARLEDGVFAAVATVATGPQIAPPAAADAVVLALWGGARDAYHDTRAATDAAVRRSRPRRALPPGIA